MATISGRRKILWFAVGLNSTNAAGGFSSSRPKTRSEISVFKSDIDWQPKSSALANTKNPFKIGFKCKLFS
jgi:hypothetical protein